MNINFGLKILLDNIFKCRIIFLPSVYLYKVKNCLINAYYKKNKLEGQNLNMFSVLQIWAKQQLF